MLKKILEAVTHISIHALREEGDSWLDSIATVTPMISIHALREEGDSKCDGQTRI